MVEQSKEQARASVHFDEDELKEYDKHRGKHIKITDPKTPYEDFNEEIYKEEGDHEMTEELVGEEIVKEEQEI